MSRTIWREKSCQRCGGDLFIDLEDEYPASKCLQCSHEDNLIPVSVVEEVKRRAGSAVPRKRQHNKEVESAV